MALVRIGRVVRAVGLDGWVGVAGSQGALGHLDEVTLQRPGAESSRRRILEARPQGRLWAVRLEGVVGRDGAEAVVGSDVLVPREALGDAGQDRHYWADLEGAAVVTEAGEPVGTITGVMETGAVDVLVVQGAKGEVLVPLAPYVRVDRGARRVVVDPPEGLLDLETPDGEEKGGRKRGE